MNNQKNRFWTFCLSLVPGAGEMYFGLYRQGVSIMLCFWALLILPMLLQVSALSLLCLILWFYSFLHTHNLRALPLEEFCQVEDRYIWEDFSANFQWNEKYKRILAVALIVLGVFLLWENLFSWIGWYLDGFLGNLMYRLPRVAIGVLVLLLGIWLIVGKRQELNREEEDEANPRQTPPYGGQNPWYGQDPNARDPWGRNAPHAGGWSGQPQPGGDSWQTGGQVPQAPQPSNSNPTPQAPAPEQAETAQGQPENPGPDSGEEA